jgi:hypothetical protein
MCQTFETATHAVQADGSTLGHAKFIAHLSAVTIQHHTEWACPTAWVANPSLAGLPASGSWAADPWADDGGCPWAAGANTTACLVPPATAEGAEIETWQCELRLAVAEMLVPPLADPKATKTTTRRLNKASAHVKLGKVVGLVLRAPCPGQPPVALVTGGQYVVGLSGPCAWRQGELVALDEMPPAFVARFMRNGTQCPFPDVRGGSPFLLYVLLVAIPVLGIGIWALLYGCCPRTFPCSKDYGVALSEQEEEANARQMKKGATSQKRAETALKNAMSHHSKSA